MWSFWKLSKYILRMTIIFHLHRMQIKCNSNRNNYIYNFFIREKKTDEKGWHRAIWILIETYYRMGYKEYNHRTYALRFIRQLNYWVRANDRNIDYMCTCMHMLGLATQFSNLKSRSGAMLLSAFN